MKTKCQKLQTLKTKNTNSQRDEQNGRKKCLQTGKWESKEIRASQGRKNHSAVDPAPEKGMEKTDQAERRSCLAER